MARKAKKILVRLRLEPKMVKELKRSGEPYWRMLPAEIIYRLRQSLGSGEPELDHAVYGWTDESLKCNRALGWAVGLLASRLERTAGSFADVSHDRTLVLGMLKVALPLLLDRLGARDVHLTESSYGVAEAAANGLYNQLTEAETFNVSMRNLLPGQRVLARIARGLLILPASRSDDIGPNKSL